MAVPQIDPSQYDAQLNAKVESLASDFAGFAMPELEVYPSPTTGYRLRAEFRVWHEGDDINYVMFEPGQKHRHSNVESCPMLPSWVEEKMYALLELLRPNELLRRKLFQVDFLSTLSGELLISLLYHKPLDDSWTEAAKVLREALRADGRQVDLVGRARKTKIVLDRDFLIEQMPVAGKTWTYQQVENSFTQPNGVVCGKMLEWALDATANSEGDLVELYCGNGNFSIPLAQNFNRVIGTEISKSSVYSAQYNIEANGVDNLTIVRMASEEFSQALQGVREFRRLKGIDLNSYDFSTVLVDPPRAGLDERTCEQISRYQRILYISCNPATLKENLQSLEKTHKVVRFAAFDQFPYTPHLEAAVLLEKR